LLIYGLQEQGHFAYIEVLYSMGENGSTQREAINQCVFKWLANHLAER